MRHTPSLPEGQRQEQRPSLASPSPAVRASPALPDRLLQCLHRALAVIPLPVNPLCLCAAGVVREPPTIPSTPWAAHLGTAMLWKDQSMRGQSKHKPRDGRGLWSGGGGLCNPRPKDSKTRFYRLVQSLNLSECSPDRPGTRSPSLMSLWPALSASGGPHAAISDAHRAARAAPDGMNGWATVAQHPRYTALGGVSVSRSGVFGTYWLLVFTWPSATACHAAPASPVETGSPP